MRKFVRTPQLLVVSTIQGTMFLLIFRYVFSGAIQAGPVPYVDFLVPGFVVTSVLFSGMGGAAGVAEDVDAGFFDRLRPDRHHAGLDAGLRPLPAHHPHGGRRALPVLGGAHDAGLTGTTAQHVMVSLLWSAALVAVFVPITVARYRSH